MKSPESAQATPPEREGTPGIDIFTIAGKSISGWVPAQKTGDPVRIKIPYASTVERRLSLYWSTILMFVLTSVATSARPSPKRITSQRPLERPTGLSMFTMGPCTTIYPITSELLSTENY
jgi:hypothetical protein